MKLAIKETWKFSEVWWETIQSLERQPAQVRTVVKFSFTWEGLHGEENVFEKQQRFYSCSELLGIYLIVRT